MEGPRQGDQDLGRCVEHWGPHAGGCGEAGHSATEQRRDAPCLCAVNFTHLPGTRDDIPVCFPFSFTGPAIPYLSALSFL